MKKPILSISLILLLISAPIFSQNTFFIKYKNTTAKEEIDRKISTNKISEQSFFKAANVEFSVDRLANEIGIEDENISRIIKVTSNSEIDLESYFTFLKYSDPAIEYVQQANIYKLDYIPNDSLLSQQWALEKIRAFEAWDITQGDQSILIGLIDTGIDYLHPDLVNKIFLNPGENGRDGFGNDRTSNGIDDDQNGFVDDWQGWDFTDRVGFPFDSTGGDYLTWDNDPMDEQGHGTNMAGIAAAETNNELGIAGAAPNIKVINLRAFDPLGYGEEDDVAAAILYAVANGAKVISMSFGDNVFSYILRDVIKYAYSQNVVLVGSSGNSTSLDPHYPSGYSEVISVGSSTEGDFVSSFSNRGSTIDLVAPGSSIHTTSPGDGYTIVSGTSAACPYVAAAAALILSEENFTNEEVKQILKSTSDDIDSKGWDRNSGAGRLNIFRALSVLAPADIKINFPLQDFATNQNSIEINATVLSPYFTSYDLYIGSGLNPVAWTELIKSGANQFSNENIFSLQTQDFTEGSYTIRLAVTLSTGVQTEERVNIHIIRSAPEIELVGVGPLYYGDKSTLLAEAYTSQRSIVRMFYRESGSSAFDFITLDGFATNNQFVKQLHYGFIPKQLVNFNSNYEVYFEAENLAGLVTVLKNGQDYFVFSTDKEFELRDFLVLPFNLPNGTIYKNPVNFLSQNYNEILFQVFYPTPDTIYYGHYQFQGDSFVKTDSIGARFPKSVGDFNSNGRIDLLGGWFTDAYIDEQNSPQSFVLDNKLKKEDFNTASLLALDVDANGTTELLTNPNPTVLDIWRIENDLSITKVDSLKNFSFINEFDRNFSAANEIYSKPVIADANADGVNELWFADADGDMLSYKILGGNNFQIGDSLITPLFGLRADVLDVGDFDGDNVDDIAVLFESNSIANNFFLLIFNFKNNQENILLQKVFLDQSMEFSGFNFSKIYQSLRFVNIDNDPADELVLNVYPYAYILKHNQSNADIIFYAEGVNSQFIYEGDINQNGVNEICLQTPDGHKFYEFGEQTKPSPPHFLSAFSTDSSTIRLEWKSTGTITHVYKATDAGDFSLRALLPGEVFLDSVQTNKTYFYKLQSFNSSFPTTLSNFSSTISVYSHQPAVPISAVSSSTNTLLVNFSERVNNTIENLNSFELIGTGNPGSVSPASQYSYLLTFRESIPVGENRIIVRKLKDFFGSPINEDTLSFTVNPVITNPEFYVASHEIINSYSIKVTFNYEVDETSALNINNYIFNPFNSISNVLVDQNDRKIIYINLDKTRPVGAVGRQYTLQIKNLVSSQTLGSLPINSGAGSFIVLSSFTDNLDNVYVYPNPVKLSAGNEKITFAKLPPRAEIRIWNLNGEPVAIFEENDGDGGVDFDLRDTNGEILSSGIYIYRIIKLDESNLEVEEKIGKFAVVR